jgi:hypothetical protein
VNSPLRTKISRFFFLRHASPIRVKSQCQWYWRRDTKLKLVATLHLLQQNSPIYCSVLSGDKICSVRDDRDKLKTKICPVQCHGPRPIPNNWHYFFYLCYFSLDTTFKYIYINIEKWQQGNCLALCLD